MCGDEVDNICSSGKLSSKQAKLSIVGSVNQSWVACGIFDLTPPLYMPDRNKNNKFASGSEFPAPRFCAQPR